MHITLITVTGHIIHNFAEEGKRVQPLKMFTLKIYLK